ncbi:MAG: hypothetical protein H0U17_04195 [Actinobacteria bacterium]|nr:hypothetical protein [Actinomycetota bacterium]
MTIDLRRAPPSREVSGARPKGEQDGDPAGSLKVRLRRLVLLAGSVLIGGLLATSLLFGGDDGATESSDPGSAGGSDASGGPAQPSSTELAGYAILLSELEGLPPDVAPGTEIEIWATWEPPVTKKLKVQQLIPLASVEKIIPSIEPGPPTVMLSLERRAIPDLIYGERFGALSVVLDP